MRPQSRLKKFCLLVLCLALCLACGAGILHFVLFDGLDNLIFSLLLKDTTVYAPGYSEQAFKTIRRGMSEHEVFTMLGKPLSEGWYYDSHKNIYFDIEGLVALPNKQTPVQKGMTKNQVVALLGEPTEKAWGYSWSPTSGSYWLRVILFKVGHVIEIHHEFYVD